jgi:phospholipase B1
VNLANLNEDRGVSFAIGGDSGALTLATLMENYQPNLKGMSLGEHLVEVSLSSYMPCLQLSVNI